MQSIGADIRNIRVANGWNQKELADMLGISQGYLSRIEKDERPAPIEVIQKISKLFNTQFIVE